MTNMVSPSKNNSLLKSLEKKGYGKICKRKENCTRYKDICPLSVGERLMQLLNLKINYYNIFFEYFILNLIVSFLYFFNS